MGLATIMAWLAIADQGFESMLMHQLINAVDPNVLTPSAQIAMHFAITIHTA